MDGGDSFRDKIVGTRRQVHSGVIVPMTTTMSSENLHAHYCDKPAASRRYRRNGNHQAILYIVVA